MVYRVVVGVYEDTRRVGYLDVRITLAQAPNLRFAVGGWAWVTVMSGIVSQPVDVKVVNFFPGGRRRDWSGAGAGEGEIDQRSGLI